MTRATPVVVDASQLSGQASGGGIGTYVRELLGQFATRTDLRVTALVTADATVPPGITRRRVTRRFRYGRPGVWEHELRRTAELRTVSGAVFHNPNPHAPILPVRPWVQTLLDLIPLVFDDPVLTGLRERYGRFGPRYARADAVVAISRHAADEGIRLLGIDPARIEIVHLGVGAEFVPGGEVAEDPPYLSIVSEYSRRKGLEEALDVVDRLARAGYPHRLAYSGRVPPWQQPAFAAVVAAAGSPGRLDALGFVDDLPALYRASTVHLMTTRYEGFGLPAVEAMACGTPVVAFDNSSLPEIVGDGGILVPDGDTEAMAKVVRRILDSSSLRSELSEAATRRAACFRWSDSAARHAEIYRSLDRA